MSKHFTCEDCCKFRTDACDFPKHAESSKHLCPFYVLGIEECYEKGRAEAIDEVYAIALNESHDTLIEWLQTQLKEKNDG